MSAFFFIIFRVCSTGFTRAFFLLSSYHGEVGDVVVGRIDEVGDKLWRIDLNSRQHAVLNLSSVNLPGGVQRRRTHEDALQMREFFSENELISVSFVRPL